MIFSASPWLKSMNCSMHLKSTTPTPIFSSVAVMPRNDAVSAALDDAFDVLAFLSLLHAATEISNVAATTTAIPDRTRTFATTHLPLRPTNAGCSPEQYALHCVTA